MQAYDRAERNIKDFYILGRADNILYMLLPIAGALFLIPSYAFWRFGVRHYKSAGN